jgi:hypothetical protein
VSDWCLTSSEQFFSYIMAWRPKWCFMLDRFCFNDLRRWHHPLPPKMATVAKKHKFFQMTKTVTF